MEMTLAGNTQVEDLVAFIERRGLHQPAIFVLEMLRPFAGSLALVTEGFAPLLGLCFGAGAMRQLQSLLEDREQRELLLSRIEESALQGRGDRRGC